MCGIFLYLGSKNVMGDFIKTRHRGPDNSHVVIEDNLFIGFHRLMINDLSYNGDQPFMHNDCLSICNGEIYNFKELKEEYNLDCKSNSDCEVILHLYLKFKEQLSFTEDIVQKLCNLLDGEFAFIIYDKTNNIIIAARDRYGVRPLFIGKSDGELGLASELKSLNDIFDYTTQFKPSTYMIYGKNINIIKNYNDISENYLESNDNIDVILPSIKYTLEESVKKRLIADVPICALLSGGLDSSLICGILSRYQKIHTFSIGLKDSTDLVYAKKVAEHINSYHHEVIVTEKEMLEAIPEVIKMIESYDITTVRASVPNYLLAKYIKNNTDFRVCFSGEMSDEVNSSYLYFKKAPDGDALHNESNKLIENLCYFDNLRADRCIAGNSLEARIPFSDHHYVKLIQSIHPKLRMCNDKIEKFLLRKAFDGSNIIPDEVLWRVKAAFSDAVSSKENSWYKIIQEYVDTKVTDNEFVTESPQFVHCTPHTKESYYYRKIFHQHYKNENIIPHFWMPNLDWVGDITDPSARELTDICKD